MKNLGTVEAVAAIQTASQTCKELDGITAMNGKFGPHLKKIGNKYYPMGRPSIHSDNLWREQDWEARREEDGTCYFEFQASAQGVGSITYEISDDEFESIKEGKLSFESLIRVTDKNKNRKPVV
ncbi:MULTISPECIES: hypothetical protein [unclassified Thalassospira]|uniref:hypothetical protein n=1 Tax=unclassified Thalassospira TaxID=2648997 RepID=UPI0007AA193B|nr:MULTISPECIES: hypothetical protein [unclassified Thalassospira]KZC98599.1 hypothetical protein AUQ41_14665 [Thalassospira sp. MCCC 1A02898]ONH86833.1 hypothetical protein TH47_15055 [Thalassospira sp. MCCC 1A02803]